MYQYKKIVQPLFLIVILNNKNIVYFLLFQGKIITVHPKVILFKQNNLTNDEIYFIIYIGDINVKKRIISIKNKRVL